MDLPFSDKTYLNKVKNACFKSLVFNLVFAITSLNLIFFNIPTASAADGDLDTSFHSDGMRRQNRTAGTDYLKALAFRADGSFVAGGSDDNNQSSAQALRMANLSFGANGISDGTFSNPNDRLFWSPLTDTIHEILLLSDGRYAFVGHAGTKTTGNGGNYDCVAVMRKSNGALDNTFDGNGKKFVKFHASNNDKCEAGALQSDNKIIVGGWVQDGGSAGWEIALARLNTDGSLDSSFGSGGKIIEDLPGSTGSYITGIEVQADGKIVVAGTSDNDFFVIRYTSTGTRDTTFSSDGIHTFDLGSSSADVLKGMKIQSDGKIVLAGYGSGNWGVARLTSTGDMDTTFGGGNGITITDFGGSGDQAHDLVIASDGKILVGGYTNASGTDFAVARYTNTGVLDTSFSSDGKATADFGSGRTDRAYAIGIAGDGNVLLAGSSKSGSDEDWAYAKFLSSTGPAAGYTVSETTRTVSETGTTQNFTVVLDSQPTGDVVFDISSSDTDEATVNTSTLTFTNANWNAPQTVTVTGIDDSIDDGDQNSTVTITVNDGSTADNNFDPLADSQITVTTTDDDTSGFTLSSTTATVSEAGTTGTFTVVLDSQPSGNVVIDLSASDTGEATVDKSTLTFTAGDWDSPQTVTVTGVDDNLDDGDQSSTFTLAVNAGSTADNSYDALANQTVSVTTVDDDGPGFTISSATATVSEAGTTATITVVLDSQPTSDVVISVTSTDTGEVTVGGAQVTFTNANWDTPQDVIVTGIDETTVDGDQTTAVTFSVVDASSADNFDPVADQTLTVTTTDDDVTVNAPTPTPTTTTTPTSPTTTTPLLGTVSLSAAPTGDTGVLNWAASDPTNVASFSLAHRDPTSGSFNNVNTFSGATLDHIATGLADGSHSFRILAVYNDGSAIASNVATINVLDGVIVPTPTTSTTAAPTTTAATTTTTTTVAPTTTTSTTTTVAPTTTTPATTTTTTTTTTTPATTTTTVAPTTTTATPTTTIPATTTTLVVQLTVVPPESDTATLSVGSAEIVTEQALEESGTSDSDDGIPPGLIATGAGLLAAAGLYLSRKWWLAFLAGTALGMLILGLFGRRPPGMPEDFEVSKKLGWEEDETTATIVWSEPEKGGKLNSYILEGFFDDKWRIVGEYDDDVFATSVTDEDIERFRMYAKGPGGESKKTEPQRSPWHD